jgi:hypothetical protein
MLNPRHQVPHLYVAERTYQCLRAKLIEHRSCCFFDPRSCNWAGNNFRAPLIGVDHATPKDKNFPSLYKNSRMQQPIMVLLTLLSNGQSQGIRRALITSGQPPDLGSTDRTLDM